MTEPLVITNIGPIHVGDTIYFARRFARGWVTVRSLGGVTLRGGKQRVWLNVTDRNGWCRAIRIPEIVRIGLY